MLPNRQIARYLAAMTAFCATASLPLDARQTEGQQAPVRAQGQTQGQRGGQQASTQGQRGAGAAGQGAQGNQTNQPARDTTTQVSTGTASISGTLTLEGSGAPVRRARVQLAGAGLRPSRTGTTNDTGQFTFGTLPAGRFTLTASKAGYVDMTYGAKKPGRPGTPIQITDGQKLDKVNFSLPKGSVITGVVVDDHGEPSPGTLVRAMRFVMRTGEKTLQQAGTDSTDDRGVYRIYGQQPGDYIVSAVPRNNTGDLRQTMMAEVESLLQQAQAANAVPGGPGGGGAGGGGRGGAGGGAGGGGGRGGGQQGLGPLNNFVGRGQNFVDQANALQQQLQQQDQEQLAAYAPVYYPGTITASTATNVTIGLGEERSGIDFQLQLVPTARIDGTISSSTGSLPQGVQIQMTPAGQAGFPTIPGISTNTARAGQDGKFSFVGVTPGQYTISARATIRQTAQPDQTTTATAATPQAGGGNNGRGGFGFGGRGGPNGIAQVLWASVDVTVSGQNLPGVVLNLQPGMTVSGQVAFQGSIPPPTDLTRVRVTIQPRGSQTPDIGGMPPAQVDATGHFSIPGVPPGHYVLQANAQAGAAGGRTGGAATGSWTLKSAIVGGRDSLDYPLEVQPNTDVSGATLTFTDKTQDLSGTLVDSSGRPTSDYTIIIFPSDKALWLPQSRRIQSSRPGTDGSYSLRGLPAGDYRLIAVTDVETGEWYDPDFLSELSSAAMPLSLKEGEKKVQDLKLAGGGH